MARFGQQFAVFVLAHLFSALFYDAAQWITSFLRKTVQTDGCPRCGPA